MRTTIFVLMLFVVSSVTGQTINLYKLTLNDSILSELTIEKLTDMLGRPSAIKKPDQLISNNYFGPVFYYHEKGLEFTFPPKSRDPQQKIQDIKVYLVKTWDSYHKEFYFPFPGKIVPSLNPNMKTNDILPLFKNYLVEIVPADTLRKQIENDLKKMGLAYNPNNQQHDVIRVVNNKNHIIFYCEEITKYLETFSFWYEKPQQKP